MNFSVTIAALPDRLTLQDVAATIRGANQQWDRVNDIEWPQQDRLARHWHVENNGEPLRIEAATGEPFAVLATEPFIEQKKIRPAWRDRHGNLKEFRDRINTFGKPSFFFEHDNRVWCAITASSKSNDAKHVVSDLLKPQLEANRTPAAYLVPNDMVYWTLHKFYEHDGRIAAPTPQGTREHLQLSDVRGYRNFTQGGHTMRTRGAGMTNLLATLAVVVENQSFSSVELEIAFGAERVCLSIFTDGSCFIDAQNTHTEFAHVPNTFDRQVLLTILIYTRILPLLHAKYQAETNAGQWNEGHKQAFVERMALQLSDHARRRIGPTGA